MATCGDHLPKSPTQMNNSLSERHLLNNLLSEQDPSVKLTHLTFRYAFMPPITKLGKASQGWRQIILLHYKTNFLKVRTTLYPKIASCETCSTVSTAYYITYLKKVHTLKTVQKLSNCFMYHKGRNITAVRKQ